MLADSPGLARNLRRRKTKFAILGEFEYITEVPEYSYLPAWYNKRARGIGGTESNKLTISSEENLL